MGRTTIAVLKCAVIVMCSIQWWGRDMRENVIPDLPCVERNLVRDAVSASGKVFPWQ